MRKTKGAELIANSLKMKEVLSEALQAAKSSANIFLHGESGTGKEVLAHFIHEHSLRKSAPFIQVNCAAIPDTLIESEFFGHEKGSFTGAIQTRMGRFELADHGTLLLDEISEVPISVQPKLLRAIQEGVFERLGAMVSREVDVRFISTSNRNMDEYLAQKLFREDLYYRLNVIPIYLPPLKERREDILPLAEIFLGDFAKENKKAIKGLSPKAKKELLEYHWPGNIRELSNAIERAVVLSSDDMIHSLSLFKGASTSPSAPASKKLRDIEHFHILQTLRECAYNKTKTASALDISVRTLRNKLKQIDELSHQN